MVVGEDLSPVNSKRVQLPTLEAWPAHEYHRSRSWNGEPTARKSSLLQSFPRKT
jgi:hypothetical protein